MYVTGFSLISRDTPPAKRELALVTASIADTIGIMASDVAGLLIQVRTCGWAWINGGETGEGGGSATEREEVAHPVVSFLLFPYISASQGCLYRANGLEGATFRCGA